MTSLEIILRRSKLFTTIHRVRIALEDLQEKTPHKTELINSQRQSWEDLVEVMEMVHHLEQENQQLKMRNAGLERGLILEYLEQEKLKDKITGLNKFL